MLSHSDFTSSHDLVELVLPDSLELLIILHMTPVQRLRVDSLRVLPVLNKLLVSLLVCKLIGKARDRACNLGESLLLIVLNAQVREHALYIFWSDATRRHVVHFADLAALQILALPWDLLLDKLVDLSL